MATMTKEEIETYVRGHLDRAGLDVVSISVESDEPPFEFYPIVDAKVRKGGLGERGVFKRMQGIEDDMSHERGTSIRAGYYEMDPEEPDYDPDLAMIEFDQFDFSLAPSAPAP